MASGGRDTDVDKKPRCHRYNYIARPTPGRLHLRPSAFPCKRPLSVSPCDTLQSEREREWDDHNLKHNFHILSYLPLRSLWLVFPLLPPIHMYTCLSDMIPGSRLLVVKCRCRSLVRWRDQQRPRGVFLLSAGGSHAARLPRLSRHRPLLPLSQARPRGWGRGEGRGRNNRMERRPYSPLT